jgi:hypothetical protein
MPPMHRDTVVRGRGRGDVRVSDEKDYELTVTVRVYGDGSAEDAARALRAYNGTFDLPHDAEVEIIDVQVPS